MRKVKQDKYMSTFTFLNLYNPKKIRRIFSTFLAHQKIYYIKFFFFQNSVNLQATGNDTCVISRVWSRIKTSNPRENPADFLGL